MSINININYSFKYESEVLSNMRKRLLTLMLVGVLGFVPTVTMFSPPNIVYAADESELEKLSKYIYIKHVSDSILDISEIFKDIYIIAFDGKDYYQISSNNMIEDDGFESIYFSFNKSGKLGIDKSDFGDAINNQEINGLIKDVINSDSSTYYKYISNETGKSIKDLLFYDNRGNLLLETSIKDLSNYYENKINKEENVGISFEYKVEDIYEDSVLFGLKYKMTNKDDIIDSIFVIDSEGNIVDFKQLDPSKDDETWGAQLAVTKDGDYKLKLTTTLGAESIMDFKFNKKELKKSIDKRKDEFIGGVKFDSTEPKVTFKGLNKDVVKGEYIEVTMKTQIPTVMSLGGMVVSDDYKKSNVFKITSNGSYEYIATSESGVETIGTLKVDCFKSVEELYPSFGDNYESNKTNSSDSDIKLPETGAVATTLIMSIIGLVLGILLIKNGTIKEVKNENENEN